MGDRLLCLSAATAPPSNHRPPQRRARCAQPPSYPDKQPAQTTPGTVLEMNQLGEKLPYMTVTQLVVKQILENLERVHVRDDLGVELGKRERRHDAKAQQDREQRTHHEIVAIIGQDAA